MDNKNVRARWNSNEIFNSNLYGLLSVVLFKEKIRKKFIFLVGFFTRINI